MVSFSVWRGQNLLSVTSDAHVPARSPRCLQSHGVSYPPGRGVPPQSIGTQTLTEPERTAVSLHSRLVRAYGGPMLRLLRLLREILRSIRSPFWWSSEMWSDPEVCTKRGDISLDRLRPPSSAALRCYSIAQALTLGVVVEHFSQALHARAGPRFTIQDSRLKGKHIFKTNKGVKQ